MLPRDVSDAPRVLDLLLQLGYLHTDDVFLPVDRVLEAGFRRPLGQLFHRQASRLRHALEVANDLLSVRLDVDLDVGIFVFTLLQEKLVGEDVRFVGVLCQVQIGAP